MATRSVRLCRRESTWRNRRKQGIAGLLRSVRDLNSNVYDAEEELVAVRTKLQATRTKMDAIKAEMDKLKIEMMGKKKVLQGATKQLRTAVCDLQNPSLYELSDEEIVTLKCDLWMAEEDVFQAFNQIQDAEDDLNFDTLPTLMNQSRIIGATRKSKKQGLNAVGRNINSISLANVISNGLISLDGTVKVTRNKCCVCLENKIDCVLYTCGHVCMCFLCAQKILSTQNKNERKCPVCRQMVKDIIKTYVV